MSRVQTELYPVSEQGRRMTAATVHIGAADRASYPFRQGLPRAVVLRLLSGTWTPSDYRLYTRSAHWQAMKARAFEVWGRACALCDSPAAQVHHRPEGYRRLFAEDPRRHIIPLCRTCHKRHHRR